jgi:hypothetical protein
MQIKLKISGTIDKRKIKLVLKIIYSFSSKSMVVNPSLTNRVEFPFQFDTEAEMVLNKIKSTRKFPYPLGWGWD